MHLRTSLHWLIKILFIIGIIIFIYYLVKPKRILPSNKEIVRDSLIRDTLYKTKDSISTQIIYLQKTYNEKKNIIMSNDTSADLQFFTNYINHYNNSRTIKDN